MVGSRNGKVVKNHTPPNTLGYCVAGCASTPPSDAPTTRPSPVAMPMKENARAWFVSSVSSASAVLVTPTLPFSKPHANLAVSAMPKLPLAPYARLESTVPNRPHSMVRRRPYRSDSHPHAMAPLKAPTWNAPSMRPV